MVARALAGGESKGGSERTARGFGPVFVVRQRKEREATLAAESNGRFFHVV